MSETELQRAIMAACNRSGLVHVVRNNTGVDTTRGVRYGLGKGGADLVGLVRGTGRVFCIEVKTPQGLVRDEQYAWLRFVRRLGGYAVVCRSVNEALHHARRASDGLAAE